MAEKTMKTIEDYAKLFQTYGQMGEKYESDVAFPYVVEGEKDGKYLCFVGTEHTNVPDYEGWADIRKSFDKFRDHSNPKKHVFIEGGVRPLSSSVEQTIVEHGDTGFAQYMAQEAGIEYSSPEPDRTEEVDILLGKGFSAREIIAYYFARQLEQWVRGDRKTNPDWKIYLTDMLEKYATVHDWNGEALSLDNVIKIYEETYGHKLEPENRVLLNNESNPELVPVVLESSRFRDLALFTAIYSKWHEGYDVLASFGSGHAFVLEPALRKLIGEDK